MVTLLFFALLGIGTGALYAAFAMSVIITYRGSGVVNFAVGALAMTPAMTFAELRRSGDLVLPVVFIPNRYSLGEPLDTVPAAAIGLAVGMAVALVAYLLIIRPLRAAPPLTILIATVGLALVLQGLAVKGFGNETIRVAGALPNGVVTLLGRPYPIDRVWALGAVCALALIVTLVYRFTLFGLATRAAFLNEKGAVLLGFEPARLGLYNWMFASAIAGAVGMLGASLGGVNPFNYSILVIPALGAALAARLHSIPVAVTAAVLIGSFEAVAVHLVAQRHVPRFFLGGIDSLVPFVVIVGALFVVGKALPNRAAILEHAHVAVARTGIRPRLWVPALIVAVYVMTSSDATIRFAGLQSLFVTTLLLSVVVLTGYLGQVSLAQLSFAGVAAFALARFDSFLPFPLAPLAAVAVTTLFGSLVSIPGLRVRGAQFAIVSFSAAVVLDDLLFRSPTLVGGNGLVEVRSPSVLGIELGITGSLPFPAVRFGVLFLMVTVACALMVVGIRRGSVGRRFLAVRSNERAAAASGIHVARTKVLGAGYASFLAGVAGVMFAYKSTQFSGSGLDAQEGLELLALAFLGGIGSIGGAIMAGLLAPSGVLIVAIRGGGTSINQFLFTGFGLILVAVKFPGGLAGMPEMLRRSVARQQAADLATKRSLRQPDDLFELTPTSPVRTNRPSKR